MSDKKYDTLVLIGRFQPLHNAHLEIIKRATALTDQLVIITSSGLTAVATSFLLVAFRNGNVSCAELSRVGWLYAVFGAGLVLFH